VRKGQSKSEVRGPKSETVSGTALQGARGRADGGAAQGQPASALALRQRQLRAISGLLITFSCTTIAHDQ
jgi:hypothetical protein